MNKKSMYGERPNTRENQSCYSRSISNHVYQVVILLFKYMISCWDFFYLYIKRRVSNIVVLIFTCWFYCVIFKQEESETGRWDEWTAPQEFVAKLCPAGLFCPSVQRSHRCGTGGQGQKWPPPSLNHRLINLSLMDFKMKLRIFSYKCVWYFQKLMSSIFVYCTGSLGQLGTGLAKVMR